MTDAELQQKRLVAAAIDVAVLIVVGALVGASYAVLTCTGAFSKVPFLGTYGVRLMLVAYAGVSLALVLARDVLAGDRSPGKKLQGIRVVTQAGTPAGVVESVKRNGLFALGSALALVGAVMGLVPCLGTIVGCMLWPLQGLAGLASLAAAGYELYLITQDPNGVRLGDQWAGTRVVRE